MERESEHEPNELPRCVPLTLRTALKRRTGAKRSPAGQQPDNQQHCDHDGRSSVRDNHQTTKRRRRKIGIHIHTYTQYEIEEEEEEEERVLSAGFSVSFKRFRFM